MFSVLIIDDEPKVREGLRTVIEWESYDYSICDECSDGIEGLSAMKKWKPDLVLVDIKMPEMDGLEFIKCALKEGYHSKFVILTGYSDFTFTKTAIQLGVKSYLLKPVEEEELIQVIGEIRSEILNERNVADYISNGMRYIRKSAVKSILTGSLPKSENEQKIIDLLDGKQFRVALAVNSNKQTGYTSDIAVDGIYSTVFRNNKDTFVFDLEGSLCVVFSDGCVDRALRIMEHLKNFLDSQFRTNVFVAIGRKTEGVSDIQTSYKDAFRLAEKRFYCKKTDIAVWDEFKEEYLHDGDLTKAQDVSIDIPAYIENFYISAEIGNMEKARSHIMEVLEVLKAKKYSEVKVKGFCSNVLIEIFRKSYENYPALRENSSMDEERITGIYDGKNMFQLADYFVLQIHMLSERIAILDSQKCIKKIIQYISANFHMDLTLEYLGELFGYNSSYLGKMFKQHTGLPFNTYLENLRMEEAKKLIKEGMKANEVAARTGFKTINYFYLVFKKNVGISTSEYKKHSNI